MKKILAILTAIMSVAFIMPASCFAADTVGFINTRMVMIQHPKYASVQKQMQSFSAQKEKEVNAGIAKLSDDKKKQEFVSKKAKEVSEKEYSLMQPIFKDIDAAVRASAKANACSVVLNDNAVMTGGKDLTKDVISRLKK